MSIITIEQRSEDALLGQPIAFQVGHGSPELGSILGYLSDLFISVDIFWKKTARATIWLPPLA